MAVWKLTMFYSQIVKSTGVRAVYDSRRLHLSRDLVSHILRPQLPILPSILSVSFSFD